MKEIYQVWIYSLGETMLDSEHKSLSEAGFKLGKLIGSGVNCWLQIRN
jgi:hypothetical protein